MPACNVGPRSAGREIEELAPVWSGPSAFAELLPRHRQVEVSVGEARVPLEGSLEVGSGTAGVASFEHHVSEVVMRLGLVRIDLDRSPVEGFRSGFVSAAK